MAFNPRAHLEKQGWKGDGLGRNEDGIKDAIKVKLKKDHAGVGHDRGEEFTYHWWDHVFNQAANSLQVTHDRNGVTLCSTDTIEITNKKKHSKQKTLKRGLYGNFVKSATLMNDGQELKEEGSGSSSDTEVKPTADESSLSNLSDEQLFKKCGRLTGHKAARHGHQLNGKLARLAQQELSSSETGRPKNCSVNGNSVGESVDSEMDCLRTNGKKKKPKLSDAPSIAEATSDEHLSSCEQQNVGTLRDELTCEDDIKTNRLKRKKKKKKQRKTSDSV